MTKDNFQTELFVLSDRFTSLYYRAKPSNYIDVRNLEQRYKDYSDALRTAYSNGYFEGNNTDLINYVNAALRMSATVTAWKTILNYYKNSTKPNIDYFESLEQYDECTYEQSIFSSDGSINKSKLIYMAQDIDDCDYYCNNNFYIK